MEKTQTGAEPSMYSATIHRAQVGLERANDRLETAATLGCVYSGAYLAMNKSMSEFTKNAIKLPLMGGIVLSGCIIIDAWLDRVNYQSELRKVNQ